MAHDLFSQGARNIEKTLANLSRSQARRILRQADLYHELGQIRDSIAAIAEAATPEAWIAPTLLNGWVNYGSGWDTAGYRKDSSGRVYLKGLVKSGTVNATAFTLPAGYRPPASKMFAAGGPTAQPYVSVGSSGNVHVPAGTDNAWVSLENISFFVS